MKQTGDPGALGANSVVSSKDNASRRWTLTDDTFSGFPYLSKWNAPDGGLRFLLDLVLTFSALTPMELIKSAPSFKFLGESLVIIFNMSVLF